MAIAISLPRDDSPQQLYERERHLAGQRALYEWAHDPGLPPRCKGVPAPERFGRATAYELLGDAAESIASGALSLYGWLRRPPSRISDYDALYALRHPPTAKHRWRFDREFARQRLNGVNPFLITCIAELPEHFPVTDEHLRGVLPDGVSLTRLLDERRVFLCDWKALAGAPLVLGRFQVAPMALFWLDEDRTLLPLAIQLGQSPAEAPEIFTPADDLWLWLTARTYVTNADGTDHEVIAHLTRTHLVMEAVWVAACRTLPPEHPVHELLAPHFTGTININDDARHDLLGPGGPIDVTMSPGSDGSFWLAEQEYRRWRLDDWNPRADFARRGVLDPDVLPGYWFRDDALALFDAIGEYVGQLLGTYYRGDEDVRDDPELLAFSRELVADDGGRLQGTPVTPDGRLATLADLVQLLQQVVYTVSAEHGAVNNGQWDQFGYIPSTPGSLFLPPPTSKHMTNEARLVYALPGYRSSVEQMAMVHMLSAPTLTPLGSYPDDYFIGSVPAERCVDRFRSRLDDIAFAIDDRNRELPAHERYTYLVPSDVGRSITI